MRGIKGEMCSRTKRPKTRMPYSFKDFFFFVFNIVLNIKKKKKKVKGRGKNK